MSAKFPKHKHELKEDSFVTTVFLATEFIKENWKKFIIGAVVLIIIIFIFFGIRASRKSLNEKALKLFDNALFSYSNNEFDKARDEFEQLSLGYGSTKYNKWSYLYLGKLELEKDSIDYAIAQDYFEQAQAKIRNKHLKEAAMLGIAKCFLGKGETERYYNYLEKITNKFPNSYSTPEYLLQIAEYYYQNNETEKAKEYYEKILKKYKDTSQFNKAKDRLTEIKKSQINF